MVVLVVDVRYEKCVIYECVNFYFFGVTFLDSRSIFVVGVP